MGNKVKKENAAENHLYENERVIVKKEWKSPQLSSINSRETSDGGGLNVDFLQIGS
ncbi:MAG: hypothetical protein MUP70_10285 [Candidatus Aminicenantes bacterium]|nr:hypothetical protein [Candidatus Aminicenantes bacterium]